MNKVVTLWGGPLDGEHVRVEPTCEVYVSPVGLYAPALAGDYARNVFRYTPPERSNA